MTPLPSIESLADRFQDVYDSAMEQNPTILSDGRTWYREAGSMIRRMAARSGVSRHRAAAVFSLYSTNNTWKGNVSMATRVCETGQPYGLTFCKERAERILAGEDPSKVIESSKLRNFYRALAGDLSAVVIDRWMMRAAGLGDNVPSGKRYAHIAEALALAAERSGELPADMQAIVWIATRGAAA